MKTFEVGKTYECLIVGQERKFETLEVDSYEDTSSMPPAIKRRWHVKWDDGSEKWIEEGALMRWFNDFMEGALGI